MMINTFFFLMSGAILPFILWPMEYFLPYPYLVEELAKYLCLVWLKTNRTTAQPSILIVIGFALLFTLTESMLYVFNLLAITRLDLFFIRFFLTGALHLSTVLVIFFGLKKPKLFQFLAILLAILIHYLFNQSVLGWL